ncbi:MAG: C1 family peptidase [Lentisphaerae bacterium]|nr:C1 family peptidase [Lentisphaerota bacterium]
MNKTYRLGWLPDVPDWRDIPFTAVFRAPRALPPRVDLRKGCSAVEDQGELGSCTAQALIGALEFLELKTERLAGVSPSINPTSRSERDESKTCHAQSVIENPKFQDLSRLFVYYTERAAQGTIKEDSGAMLRTGIKVLKKQGVCRESLWPYRIQKFKNKPTPDCFTEALLHQVTAYQRLNSLQDMKACLAMGLPFVLGFAVYEHVMSAVVARTGRIRMPGRRERMLGGHAVMAVGYEDKSRRFAFRNSWGQGWGKAGYGTIPYAYLESRDLSDDFWCVQATENDFYSSWRVRSCTSWHGYI